MNGITVSWLDPTHTILLWEYGEHYTWEDCDAATQQALELIESVPHVVDALMDYRGNRVMPADAADRLLDVLKHHPLVEHPRAGLAVYVGGGARVEFLLGLFTRVYRGHAWRVARAHSVAVALDLIAARRVERGRGVQHDGPGSPVRVSPLNGD